MRKSILWAVVCVVVAVGLAACGGGGGGGGTPSATVYKDTWTVGGDGKTVTVTGNTTGTFVLEKTSSDVTFGSSYLDSEGNAPTWFLQSLARAPLLKFPPDLNTTWSVSATNNGFTVNSTTTITSVNDNVTTVDNSNWTVCVRTVENLTYPGGFNWSSYPISYVRWFCPSVGLVKFTTTFNDSTTLTAVAETYFTGGNTNDYFPLASGYSWTYKTQ